MNISNRDSIMILENIYSFTPRVGMTILIHR